MHKLLIFLLSFVFLSCSSNRVKNSQTAHSQKVKTFAFMEGVPFSFDRPYDDKLKQELRNNFLSTDERNKNYLTTDLYLKATHYREKEQLEEAAFLFELLNEFSPKNYTVTKNLVVVYIRGGFFDKAEELLESLDKMKMRDMSSFKLILAGLFNAQGKIDKSLKIYREILALEPANEEACIFLAKSLGVDLKFDKAVKQLKSCIKHDKTSAIFHYYLGKIYLADEKAKKSDRSFLNALEVDPTYYQAIIGRGLIKEEAGDYKSAAKIYKGYLEVDSDNFAILTRLVQTLFLLDKFKEVTPYMEELIRQDPDNLNLKVRLGILYSEIENYEGAKVVFKNILGKVPGSDKVLYYLGALYQQTEDFESAIEYYSKIERTSSLYYDSNIQIGKILKFRALTINTNSRYLNELRQLITKLPEDYADSPKLKVELAIILSSVLDGQNRKKAAVEVMVKFSKGADLTEDQKYYLASLYDKAEMYEDALNLMLTVVEKNPNNPHALNFVGYLMLENGGELDVAFDYINQAIKLKPDDAYIRDSLGWYYYKRGNFKKALVELEKAWKQEKNDVVITKHLAMVYQQLENDEQAQKYFAEALKNCELPSQKEDVIKSMKRSIKRRLPASLLED